MWEFRQEIKDKWIKAAALASIWASIEIVFGSFLHNIHAPLTGTVLTFTSVVLLTVFGFYWKEKGIFWRAGLITALMKSISPSAVLLGPMTAIFTEGILFELGIALLGKNYLGFTLGGVLAMASALVHKALVLLVLYGMKLVVIAKNLYYYVVKQLGVHDISFSKALILLLWLYVVVGVLAVAAGYYIARKISRKKTEFNIPQISQQLKIEDHFWKSTTEEKKSPWITVLIVLVGALMLWTVEHADLRLVTALVALYVVAGYFYYPFAFRYFKKGGFWIQITLIFVITVLFYNGFNGDHKHFFSEEGFIVAIRLVYRVLVLILTFSALSIELRNPLVKAILFRLGFSHLYYALVLAFSALPTFFNEISYVRKYLKLNAFLGLVFITDELVRAFKSREISHKVYIISGCKDCGKTTFAKKMVEQLRMLGISVGGFVTEKSFSKEGFVDYYVKDLERDRKALLCTTQKLEDYIFKTAKLYFSSAGLSLGCDILETNTHPVVLVDEVGALELKGHAWSDAIEKLFFGGTRQIWVIRDKYVNSVLKKFFVTEAVVFEVDVDNPDDAAYKVLHNMLKQ